MASEARMTAVRDEVAALLASRREWSHVRAALRDDHVVLIAREDDGREAEVVRIEVNDGSFTVTCLCAPGLWQRESPWTDDLAMTIDAVAPWAFSPTERLRCPCCGQDRALASQEHLRAADEAAHRRAPTRFHRGAVLALARRRDWQQWACDECLVAGRALRGDLERQAGMFDGPRVAYLPVTRPCRDCERPFVFTPERQRAWYERMGHYLGRHPTRCDACGRAHGERVQAMHALQAALPDLDPRDPAALVRVARLYARLGSNAKADEFLRRASNRARGSANAPEIEAQIAALRAERDRDA